MVVCFRLVVIILFTNISGCESCDLLYLNKWAGTHDIYREAASSEHASKSLLTCSQWCIENPSCLLLSWSPGSCWQVGYCGTQIVTEIVYNVGKEGTGWSYDTVCKICLVMWQLWTGFEKDIQWTLREWMYYSHTVWCSSQFCKQTGVVCLWWLWMDMWISCGEWNVCS